VQLKKEIQDLKKVMNLRKKYLDWLSYDWVCLKNKYELQIRSNKSEISLRSWNAGPTSHIFMQDMERQFWLMTIIFDYYRVCAFAANSRDIWVPSHTNICSLRILWALFVLFFSCNNFNNLFVFLVDSYSTFAYFVL
jgi:hypothetical protein